MSPLTVHSLPILKMAYSHEYLSISVFLLVSLCVSGGIGSEYTYSCEFQLVNEISTVSEADKQEGQTSDCIQIEWVESQKQYGLKAGEVGECLKMLTRPDCRQTDRLTSDNDEFRFNNTIGKDEVAFEVNCKMDFNNVDASMRHFNKFNVWECGDDVIHRYYILNHGAALKYMARCSAGRIKSCLTPIRKLRKRRFAVVALNKEVLIKYCNELKPAMQCVKNILKDCSKLIGFKLEVLLLLVNSTLNNLCDVDRPFSKDYLKHAPCMAEAEKTVGDCARNKSEEQMAKCAKRDLREMFCCSVEYQVACTKQMYNEKCGSVASLIGHQMARTTLGSIFENPCVDFDGDLLCGSCKSQFSMSPAMQLLSLATLFIMFRSINHF